MVTATVFFCACPENDAASPLFFAIGMHCLGCPSSRGETVEEACMVHGVDCEPFLAQLNNFLEAYEANEAAKQNG